MTIVLSILPWWAFANYILKFNFISFLATSTNTSNKSAIKKANRKYPNEALEIDDDNINDVAAHYDYLMRWMETNL